jgi:hypothetical protein
LPQCKRAQGGNRSYSSCGADVFLLNDEPNSSGGWNRTNVPLVQSQASLPTATAPECLLSVRGGGFEPPSPDSKSGSLPLADPRSFFVKSDLRKSNPRFQLGRLAPIAARPRARKSGRGESRTHKAGYPRSGWLDCFRDSCRRPSACPSVHSCGGRNRTSNRAHLPEGK